MVEVVANEKATETFDIPVSWKVLSSIRVQANTLEEAYKWAVENADDFPLDYDDCEYADESYEIDTYEEAKIMNGLK